MKGITMGNIKRNQLINATRANTGKSNNSFKRGLKALSGQPQPTGSSCTKKYASKKLRNAVAKRQVAIFNNQA